MTREYIKINKDIMKWARITSGYTIEEASKKVSKNIEKIENGEVLPTFNQLYEAAKVYKRPVQIFNFKEPPEDIRLPHDFTVYDFRNS
jgi:hypothetical protein